MALTIEPMIFNPPPAELKYDKNGAIICPFCGKSPKFKITPAGPLSSRCLPDSNGFMQAENDVAVARLVSLCCSWGEFATFIETRHAKWDYDNQPKGNSPVDAWNAFVSQFSFFYTGNPYDLIWCLEVPFGKFRWIGIDSFEYDQDEEVPMPDYQVCLCNRNGVRPSACTGDLVIICQTERGQLVQVKRQQRER